MGDSVDSNEVLFYKRIGLLVNLSVPTPLRSIKYPVFSFFSSCGNIPITPEVKIKKREPVPAFLSDIVEEFETNLDLSLSLKKSSNPSRMTARSELPGTGTYIRWKGNGPVFLPR